MSLDDGSNVVYDADLVDQELALIAEQPGMPTESPIVNYKTDVPNDKLLEDYTQYKPRGHYTKSDELKAYFQSMMWYGRITWRNLSQEETKTAILMTYILNQNDDIKAVWEKIFEPINFFVGKTDDLTYYDYKEIFDQVYGSGVNTTNITNQAKLTEFISALNNLEGPQINSMPILAGGDKEDREAVIKGYRFMGQRFTIDASVFQRLIYREVGDKTTTCSQFDPDKNNCQTGARCLPTGLDVTAAMSSDEAYSILDNLGETDYACYPENMTNMKNYIEAQSTDIWTQNLYWGWLYMLRPLLTEKTAGWPSFMQNQAWQRKDLNSYLGSWTELKHDTILYAKQAYAELGGGPSEEKDDRGYVEPEIDTYARLAGLIKMTKEGLQIRNLLSDQQATNLDELETLVMSLKTISEKELKGQDLTDDEYELIKTYGGSLEHFWLDAISEKDKEGKTNDELLISNPAPLVADVATDPNGSALEEATGKIDEIYAVVPVAGSLRIAKGGVYSYYEFSQSLADGRLTDEEWREKLNNQQAPDRPSWTSSFLASQPSQ